MKTKAVSAPEPKQVLHVNTSLRKKGFMFYLRRDWQLYALIAIPLAFAIVFKFLPMLGLSLAFLKYTPAGGFAEAEFIGLDTFKYIFQNKEFYTALKNTLVLNFLDLIAGFPAPVILALLLNEITSKWYKRVSQTILYLPHFLSWAIIGGIVVQLFIPNDGYVNIIMAKLGFQQVPFLTDPNHWVATYVLVGVWQSMGWGTIIYLAAMTAIPSELYEAATMDGAGRWRKIWNITLPCIRPTIVVMLIMALGRIMGSGLERPLALENTMVKDVSTVLASFIYRKYSMPNGFSISTAVGLFQSLVGVILVLAADRFAKIIGEDGIV